MMTCLVVAMVLVLGVAVCATVGQGSEGLTCRGTFFSSLVQLIPCRAAVSSFSPIPPGYACCNAVKYLGQTTY
ncbi:hypothetical protein MLD38_027190 [Melastoma candidum]|uniref:Uncharacterized protein n=1 Tax=Melastoma candidum TaxID=119954 RepID=A0ACB9P1F3_9MYRT|nr:hypothetical protein MLD38_027190 [Melastoma candidum]